MSPVPPELEAAAAGGGGTLPAVAGPAFGFPAPAFDAAAAVDQAKSLYGYLGWFVDHPEIGPLILKAAEEGWDLAKLQGELAKTDWWKRTSDTARQWDALVASDQATAERRIDETALSIALQAGQMGARLTTDRLAEIATSANRFGWNESEINLAIASEMRWDPNANPGGTLGTLIAQVKEVAAEYMVPVTDHQAWQWARRIVAGGATIDAVEAQFGVLAKSRFPQIADVLDQGVTPAQFFAPYRNTIAQILEVSPGEINLMDDKWSPVISFRNAKGGELRPMTIGEAERFARMDPAWAETDNAWETLSAAGSQILDMFGGLGGAG